MTQTKASSNAHPLLPQQELFCTWYTTPGDTFFHATFSYAEAYDYELPLRKDNSIDTDSSEYKACKANAARLMFKTETRERVTALLLEQFNEKTADAKVAEIMQRGKDGDALAAVKIFNDLKQRITKKIDVTTQGRPLAGMSDEELLKLAGE